MFTLCLEISISQMTCAIYINIDINLVILTVFTMLVDLKTGIKTTKEGILVLQNILQQGSLFFEYSYIRQKKHQTGKF